MCFRRYGATVFLVLAWTFGCVERKLTVTSEPEGALVYLNNQEIGRTPVTRDFTWYGNYDVQLRQEGYETLKTQHYVVAPWWQWVPLDVLPELTPWRWKDHRTMSFAMRPAATQAVSGEEMLDRAAELRAKLESSEHTRAPTTTPTPTPTPTRAPPPTTAVTAATTQSEESAR
jgi:hypothetical protein